MFQTGKQKINQLNINIKNKNQTRSGSDQILVLIFFSYFSAASWVFIQANYQFKLLSFIWLKIL